MKSKKTKKPNVLVAGFPRCGSTYLYNILKQHPEIFIPELKEINYFNIDHFFLFDPTIINPRFFKSKKWYYSFFKTNKKIVMDFSILCALDPSSARRARKELGDAKILFVTREKEAYLKSVWKGMKNWGEIYEDYREYGDIDYYMDNYRKVFSNVYVFSMEKFNKNQKAELKKLMKFLGVKDFNFDLQVNAHVTPKKGTRPSFSQYWRRTLYVKLSRIYYKFISLFVTASAIPDRSK